MKPFVPGSSRAVILALEAERDEAIRLRNELNRVLVETRRERDQFRNLALTNARAADRHREALEEIAACSLMSNAHAQVLADRARRALARNTRDAKGGDAQ